MAGMHKGLFLMTLVTAGHEIESEVRFSIHTDCLIELDQSGSVASFIQSTHPAPTARSSMIYIVCQCIVIFI